MAGAHKREKTDKMGGDFEKIRFWICAKGVDERYMVVVEVRALGKLEVAGFIN